MPSPSPNVCFQSEQTLYKYYNYYYNSFFLFFFLSLAVCGIFYNLSLFLVFSLDGW